MLPIVFKELLVLFIQVKDDMVLRDLSAKYFNAMCKYYEIILSYLQ